MILLKVSARSANPFLGTICPCPKSLKCGFFDPRSRDTKPKVGMRRPSTVTGSKSLTMLGLIDVRTLCGRCSRAIQPPMKWPWPPPRLGDFVGIAFVLAILGMVVFLTVGHTTFGTPRAGLHQEKSGRGQMIRASARTGEAGSRQIPSGVAGIIDRVVPDQLSRSLISRTTHGDAALAENRRHHRVCACGHGP